MKITETKPLNEKACDLLERTDCDLDALKLEGLRASVKTLLAHLELLENIYEEVVLGNAKFLEEIYKEGLKGNTKFENTIIDPLMFGLSGALEVHDEMLRDLLLNLDWLIYGKEGGRDA